MILESQEKYLATRPDRIVLVKPFDPRVREVGNGLVKELQEHLPNLKIYFWGAAALGIAGQNDIDINIFTTPNEYDIYRPVLERMFGQPTKITKSIKWEFKQEGFDTEVYLTDKDSPTTQEQLRVFEILSGNKELRSKYEKIKLPQGEQDYKQYMRKKYEFFNRILGIG